jgi:LemA protein
MLRIIFAIVRNPAFLVGMVLVITGALLYNRLIRARTKVEEALSLLAAQLNRRRSIGEQLNDWLSQHELAGKKIEKELIRQESEALSGLSREAIPGRASEEAWFGKEVRRVFNELRKENKLQEDESLNRMWENLQQTDESLEKAERYYNALVREYNVKVESFPSGMLAVLLNMQKLPFFVTGEEQSEA